jgi:hypothetical protein
MRKAIEKACHALQESASALSSPPPDADDNDLEGETMKVRVTSRATAICRCHVIVDDDSSSKEEEEVPMKVNIGGQYGPKKGPFRIAVEQYFCKHPYWLTHAFPKGSGGNQYTQGMLSPVYLAYTNYMLLVYQQMINPGGREFQSNDKPFCASLFHYKQSFHGQIVKSYEHGRKMGNPGKMGDPMNARDHALRQTMCGLHTLESFKNHLSTKKVCESIMNEPNKMMGDMSLVEYAETTGGIYF